jgi:hypothetical protein
MTLSDGSLNLRLEVVSNLMNLVFTVTNPTAPPRGLLLETTGIPSSLWSLLLALGSTIVSFGRGFYYQDALPYLTFILRDAPDVTDIDTYWFKQRPLLTN